MKWNEEDVEFLLHLWAEESPDPVDIYEDQLAAEHGLVRYPALSLANWRELRVTWLDEVDSTHSDRR